MLFHPQLQLHQISLRDYHQMIEVGILTEADRVELIEGHLVTMSPKGSKHAACIAKIMDWLPTQLPNSLQLRVQDPIQVPELSEPEPDIALVDKRADYYADAHPLASEVRLVIEVADSSLKLDQSVKKKLYGKAGIQEYWIINLVDRQIECYTEWVDGAYHKEEIFASTDQITSPVLDFDSLASQWLI